MNRSLIVARLTPGAERNVADIFARSDATALPVEIGVRERALFGFHGLYLHLIDFDQPPEQAMQQAQRFAGFRSISDELRPHIQAYDPDTWRSPKDAMARCFYHWRAPGGATAGRASALAPAAPVTP